MPIRPGSTGPATVSWAILVWVVALAASLAHASSIMVNGPAGAQLSIDGRAQGALPLANPISLTVGAHTLRCEMAGHRAHVEEFELTGPDHQLTLTVSLLPISRWKATGYSLLLAGLGQHYQDRHRAGWTLLAVQAVAVGFAVHGERRFKDQRDAYEDVYSAYQQALDFRIIEAKKAEAMAAYDELEKAETYRNVALWAVLGTAVVSAVDAWLAHDSLFVRGGDAPAHAASEAPVQVGWRVRF